ncbi:hypothetical protein KTE19_12590 [Lentilactobacillus sp. IMAU92037]|uniref:hypothetical protein n=1 Tax=Lentilactobacillus TaxID=2767893 RepID=UPI001C2BBF86|nr:MULTISPECIES: hypothetical protein [Lentilactobacillus]MBV0931517.1 hypothetical protein [Lentilactobacillus dabitei]MDM7517547.1 hypothetical protein [Lentilactobacillus sp. TOM.63]
MNFKDSNFYLLLSRMAHSITVKKLKLLTGIEQREVYAIFNKLLMQYDVPIGAMREGSRGYFIIANEEKRKQSLAPLQSHTANME